MNPISVKDLTRYRDCKALVLGASGFIGRWVARYLSLYGADLSLVVRDRLYAEHVFSRYAITGTIWEVDLSNFKVFQGLFIKLKPSIVFNLAGYGVDHTERDEDIAYKINSQLVEVIAETALKTCDSQWEGLNLVHIGSALEYGAIGGNLSEDSIPSPTTLYGRTKLEGTLRVKHYGFTHGLRGITARLFTVYGPGEHEGRLLPSLIKATKTDAPISLTAGHQKRDFVFVSEVAEGLLRMGITTAEPGEIINFASGNLTTVRKFVTIAANILCLSCNRLNFGAIPTRTEEMEHNPVNIQRMVNLLNWKPTISIAEGIQHTIDFENEHIYGKS